MRAFRTRRQRFDHNNGAIISRQPQQHIMFQEEQSSVEQQNGMSVLPTAQPVRAGGSPQQEAITTNANANSTTQNAGDTFQSSAPAAYMDTSSGSSTLLYPLATARVDAPEAEVAAAPSSSATAATTTSTYSQSRPQLAPLIPVESDSDALSGIIDGGGGSFLFRSSNTRRHPKDEMDRLRLLQAERRGLIEAEMEKEDISKAERDAYAKRYFERQAIKAANEVALLRDRQDALGVVTTYAYDMQKNDSSEAATTHRISADASATKSRQNNQPSRTCGKGYEVTEYDTKDYETKNYDVTEYKSVYDD